MKPFSRWMLFWITAFIFLAPLKFGTPVVLQTQVQSPANFFEWIFFSWPNQLAVILGCGTLLWMVLDSSRLTARLDLLFLLPVVFLVTQLIAMPHSICPQTSADTLMHFAVCVLLFYAAAWYVRDGKLAEQVFGGLGLATFLILIFAVQQHFGGLEQTREFSKQYGDNIPHDLKMKLMSNRVFATLVYPNALAAWLVLAFAPMLAWIWVRGRGWNTRVKWWTMIFVGGLIVFCLVLTGSRGGFISFAAMVLAAVFCLLPRGSRRTWWVLGVVAVLGGVFLLAHETGLIRLGTSSIDSRRDYWQGAVRIARDHPWLGTGPGTFGSIYPKYKVATSEEAQLVHNNYLEMWCDSGVTGFVVFALLWLVALRDAFALARQRYGDAASIAVCAALAGWVVHGLMDFDLYVPGVALPAFILLGIMQGLKELPDVKMVPSTGKPRWGMAVACVGVMVFVVWSEGKSLLAWHDHGEALLLAPANPEEASVLAHRAIALEPDNPHYDALAGDLSVTIGRFEEAIELYRMAIKCDPFRASYHWRLARVLMVAGGKDRDVIDELTAATRLNPTHPHYQDDLQEFIKSIRQPPPVLLDSAPTKKEP